MNQAQLLCSALPEFLKTVLPAKRGACVFDTHQHEFYLHPEQAQALTVLIKALNENIELLLRQKFNEGTSLLLRMNTGSIGIDDFAKTL